MTTLRARKNFLKEGLVRLCAQLRSVVDEETISPSEAAAQFDDLVVRHKEYASLVAELSDQLQGFGEVDRLAKLSREANQMQKDLEATNREVDEYLRSGRADIFLKRRLREFHLLGNQSCLRRLFLKLSIMDW